ncbi:MAG: alpha/beta fold hydrolase [Pseudomonadota bacterium]
MISLMAVAMGWANSAADERPPIEVYGNLPALSNVTISPAGDQLAFIFRGEQGNQLRVMDLATGELTAIGLRDLSAGGVSWASPEHVIIRATDNIRTYGFRGRFQYSAAFAVNTRTKKMARMLDNTDGLFPAQSGLGRIVGKSDDADKVFMPGFMGSRTNESPPYSLLRVDLDNGRGRVVRRGNNDTIDWYIDESGRVLAQEEYNDRTNIYEITTQVGDDFRTILKVERKNGPMGLVGVAPDQSGLLFLRDGSDGFEELHMLNFQTEEFQRVLARDKTEIDYVLLSENRTVFGVAYGGLRPSYDFFDEGLDASVKQIQEMFPETSTWLTSWSDDWNKLTFRVEGSGHAGDYYLFDRAAGKLTSVSSAWPDIPANQIADVLTIEYPASDGLKIPGILTVPPGAPIENLPMIVMPHGGPESHDVVGFDYMAQFFANRGYLVLQPNFRGSDGFGSEFTRAGYGEWGGAMQQDITDGANALIEMGAADPSRVCIVGWSYGGYAALAGGAFTPDLYQCVAAIAPVSDLPRMMSDEKKDHGNNHWVVGYWERAMANGNATRETLSDKSPAMFAENFKAPVLLLHGKDDLIVPVQQSRRMRRALERAGRDVKLVEYRGQDHSLSTPGMRLKALQELDAFVTEHIGTPTN